MTSSTAARPRPLAVPALGFALVVLFMAATGAAAGAAAQLFPASPAPPISSDPTPSPNVLDQWRSALSAAHPVAVAELRVESEILYSVRFSERPGARELSTRALDPVRMAAAPRPPLWWPEARVQWGQYLWDGRVEDPVDGRLRSLLDRDAFRLVSVELVEARGRRAALLEFEGSLDRVWLTVDATTFEPLLLEQTLERSAAILGTTLEAYHLRLSFSVHGGRWLVAQGEESFELVTSEGRRSVEHRWKALRWQPAPRARAVLQAGDVAVGGGVPGDPAQRDDG